MSHLRNYYPGKTISELLEIRDDIMDARNSGNQVVIGLEMRISHQFNKMTPQEMNQRLDQVDYSLYLLAKAANCANPPDPSLLEIYKNPYHHTSRRVRTVYGWPFPYQTQPGVQ